MVHPFVSSFMEGKLLRLSKSQFLHLLHGDGTIPWSWRDELKLCMQSAELNGSQKMCSKGELCFEDLFPPRGSCLLSRPLTPHYMTTLSHWGPILVWDWPSGHSTWPWPQSLWGHASGYSWFEVFVWVPSRIFTKLLTLGTKIGSENCIAENIQDFRLAL